MARTYNDWEEGQSDDSYQAYQNYQEPESDPFKRFVIIAFLMAVVLHGVAWFILDQIPLLLESKTSWQWQAKHLHVERPTVLAEDQQEHSLANPVEEAAPDRQKTELLSELDEVVPALKDVEVDVSPQVTEPQMDLSMPRPALEELEVQSSLSDPKVSEEAAMNLKELAPTADLFERAAEGQMRIKANEAIENALAGEQLDSTLLKNGEEGLEAQSAAHGFSRLQDLLAMPEGELAQSKAMIGSDLLFEFGEVRLRESARASLMKVATLIEMNPQMYCWIEGHTDLFGESEYNRQLSYQRAEAVRDYLKKAFGIHPERLCIQAYGEQKPIVFEGNREQQSVNRRVEIKLRKTKPQSQGEMRKSVQALEIQGQEGVLRAPSSPIKPVKPVIKKEDKKERVPQALPVKPSQESGPVQALPLTS